MATKTNVKWGIGFIIFGLLLVSLIDWAFEQEENEEAEENIVKLFWAAPFILIGLAIILFRGREDKIEKIKEGTK